MSYFVPDSDRSILSHTYQYVSVLYSYHFLVRHQRVSQCSHISELLRFGSCSVSIFKYASVLTRMGPYMFFIRPQFNVTLATFSTNLYCLVWVCTGLYLWLSNVHFAEQSMVYHLWYSNLCIPPVIILDSSVLISIWLCVEFISHKYRVYRRKYLGFYSYCSILRSTNLYNAVFKTSLNSRPTSYVVYCIDGFCSARYCPVLACIDQDQYIDWVHSIYSQPFGQNK